MCPHLESQLYPNIFCYSWQLEVVHGKSIYTIEIGKHYKSWLPPHQLLNIYLFINCPSPQNSLNYTHPLGDLIQSHGFKHHLTLQELNYKGKKEREEEPIFLIYIINHLQKLTLFGSRFKETNSKIIHKQLLDMTRYLMI